ncbi:hypothetical protein HF895_03425 [Bacteroides sp. AN502]|nr:hypothetical protein [Caecibacteroides pullorum]MDC6279733.1 hypothetical protein [Caecibacteroides pullorum]
MSITHQTMGWHNRGSLWQGVALSADPVTAVPSVRDAKKSEVRYNPTASHLRGSIWHRCGSLWRSSGSNKPANKPELDVE